MSHISSNQLVIWPEPHALSQRAEDTLIYLARRNLFNDLELSSLLVPVLRTLGAQESQLALITAGASDVSSSPVVTHPARLIAVRRLVNIIDALIQ